MRISNEDLEKELTSLLPKAPSGQMKANIEKALAEPDSTRSGEALKMWPITIWAIAACLALVLSILFLVPDSNAPRGIDTLAQKLPDQTLPENGLYEPIEAEQILTNATDEGVFVNSDNEPMRRLRYQFIDSITMVNKSDGSVFTMELPREEVLMVPLTLL